jgi:hypothetical protein
MTTTPQRPSRDLVLTIVTGIVALAATVFAVAATMYMFPL